VSTRILRIATIQYEQKPIKELREFYEEIDYYLDEAKGVDVIVFPEAFSIQLLTLVEGRDLKEKTLKMAKHYDEIESYFKKA